MDDETSSLGSPPHYVDELEHDHYAQVQRQMTSSRGDFQQQGFGGSAARRMYGGGSGGEGRSLEFEAPDYDGAGGIEYEPYEYVHDEPYETAAMPVQAPRAVGSSQFTAPATGQAPPSRVEISRMEGSRGVGASTSPGTQADASQQFTAKLTEKIQSQAKDLQRLAAQLGSAEGYIKLCEAKILELAPDQTLPLTERDLKGRKPSVATQAKSVLPAVRNTPSYVLSENARLIRENKDLSAASAKLEAELKGALAQAQEHAKAVREMKRAVEAKDKELMAANRRSERLGAQVSQLESSSKATEEYVSKMEKKLAGGKDRLQANLAQKNAMLQEKLQELDHDRRALEESLRAEQMSNEEQRAFIQVLKNALESKAQDLGISGVGENKGKLLIELAELRGRLETARKESLSRDQVQRELEAQLHDAQSRGNQLEDMVGQLQEQLAKTQEDLSAQSGERGVDFDELAKLREQNATLLDYVQEKMDDTSKVQADLDDVRAALDSANSEKRQLQENLDKAEVLMDKLNAEIMNLSKQLETSKSTESALRRQIQDLDGQKQSTEDRAHQKEQEYEELSAIQIELLNAIREAKKEAQDVRSEMEQVQAEHSRIKTDYDRRGELINTIQDELTHFRQRANDRAADQESAIQQRDAQIGGLSETVAQLQEEVASGQERIEALQNELGQALEHLEGEKGVVDEQNLLLKDLESRLNSVTSELEQTRRRLQDTLDVKTHAEEVTAQSRKETTQLLQRAQDMQADILNRASRIAELESQLHGVQAQLADKVAEIERLLTERQFERKIFQDELFNLRSEKEVVRKSAEELRSELTKLHGVLDTEKTSRDRESNTHSDQMSSMRDQLQRAQHELARYSAEVLDLQGRLDLLEQERQRLSKDLDEAVLHIQGLSGDRDAAIVELGKLRVALQDATSLADEREAALHEREEEFAHLSAAMESQKQDHAIEHKIMLSQIKALENDKARLVARFADIEEQSKSEITHSAGVRERLAITDAELVQTKADLDKVRAELQARVEALATQLRESKMQLDAANLELSGTKSRVKDLETHASSLQLQKEAAEDRLRATQVECDSLRVELSAKTQQLKGFQDRLLREGQERQTDSNQAQLEVQSLLALVNTLKADATQKSLQITELENRREEAERKLVALQDSVRAQMENSSGEMLVFKTMYEDERARVSILEAELQNAKVQYEKILAEIQYDMESYEKTFKSQSAKIEQLETDKANKDKLIAALQVDAERSESSALSMVRAENEQLQQRAEQLLDLAGKLDAEIAEKNLQITELQNAVRKLSADKSDLENHVANLEDRVGALGEAKEALQEVADGMAAERADLKAQLADLIDKKTDLLREIERLKTALTESNVMQENLVSQLQVEKSVRKVPEAELSVIRVELSSMHSQLQTVQEEKRALELMLQSKEAELQQAQGSLSVLQVQRAVVEDHLASAKSTSSPSLTPKITSTSRRTSSEYIPSDEDARASPVVPPASSASRTSSPTANALMGDAGGESSLSMLTRLAYSSSQPPSTTGSPVSAAAQQGSTTLPRLSLGGAPSEPSTATPNIPTRVDSASITAKLNTLSRQPVSGEATVSPTAGGTSTAGPISSSLAARLSALSQGLSAPSRLSLSSLDGGQLQTTPAASATTGAAGVAGGGLSIRPFTPSASQVNPSSLSSTPSLDILATAMSRANTGSDSDDMEARMRSIDERVQSFRLRLSSQPSPSRASRQTE